MNKNPLHIKNPSKMFQIGKDRQNLSLSSSFTHKFARSKQMGYETRLFYEYKYCEKMNGQTFFFTLTYNDANIPIVKYGDESFSSFDYFDLVELLNGGFKKQLLRKYGTNFKYFVSCELGEGAGKRGFANNPHYHCLFFLRPDTSKGHKPYKKIDPFEFRSLLRQYWQGFDEDIDKINGVFHPYQKAKKGIVKEGKYGISVTSFRAVTYVAKYVCKSFDYIKREQHIENLIRDDYSKSCRLDDVENIKNFVNAEYPKWREQYPFLNDNLLFDLQILLDNFGARQKYNTWYKNLVESLTQNKMSEYRNRYGLKTRISNNVGEFALEFIDYSFNSPTLSVTTSKGVQHRPINLYYYRKLYTEIVKDNDGKPVRILNQAGIDFKCSCIEKQVRKLAFDVKSKVDVLTPSLYESMLNSSVYDSSNYSIDMSFAAFKACYQGVADKDDLFLCYGKYKLVYKDRFCPFVFNEHSLITEFPVINLVADYRRFLRSSVLQSCYNPMSCDYQLQADIKDYISYNAHPYFHRYLFFFSVFDLLADYLFVSTDNKKERDWKELQRTKEFHSYLKVNDYYRNLNI